MIFRKKGKKFETELIETSATGRFSKVIKDTTYDNIKLFYTLFPKKELDLREFFEIIVGDRFEQKHKEYIMEVYRDYHQVRHCKSIDELMYYSTWAHHFVPNSFYKWNDRSLENLRCSQWMVFDFERKRSNGKAFLPAEVFEIFRQTVGFEPTIIKQTKSYGHYHVFLKHTTINGSTESSYLFKRIQKKIAEKIGCDMGALGPNHNFSIPKGEQKIFYFGDNTIDFNVLKKWWYNEVSKENARKAYEMNDSEKVTSITEIMVWKHPAILALQNHEYDGSRNEAGFTLALLYYALNKDLGECESYLYNEWFPRVPQRGDVYHVSALKASIKSAYSGKYAGPSKEKIEGLTDIAFDIRIRKSTYKKEKLHNKNENRQAIINYFRQCGGSVVMKRKDLVEDICRTQESPMDKPFSADSINRNLGKLKKEGVITWEKSGHGRNAGSIEFVLKDGIQETNKTIIEVDKNIYVFGKVVDFN